MWQSRAGTGVLVVRDERVLMVCRERLGKMRWELPSGLVEGSETFEEAAQREAFEETGIQVAIGDLLCTVVIDEPTEHYRSINVYFHAAVLSQAEPAVHVTDEPISEVRFVDLASLPARKIHPVDRRILRPWQRRPDRPPYHLHIAL